MKAWAEQLSLTRIEPSEDMLESLVTLCHMANKQMEDPATQGALGSRNSLRSPDCTEE